MRMGPEERMRRLWRRAEQALSMGKMCGRLPEASGERKGR